MIEFKENIKKNLPYNREQYIDFLDEDSFSSWYGVSFQLNNKANKIGLTEFIENYIYSFKDIITTLDNGFSRIINHDDKDLKWFPNNEGNLTALRSLLKEYSIPNTITGALIFTTDDLLKYSKDLISYPYSVFDKTGLLYKNLDISHSQLPFIIKISGHLNIDLLSTHIELLRKIVNENHSNSFILKEYRGTSL